MKGGIQGLKVSQSSVILVGLVCVTALMVACMKSSFLASLIPNQSQVLQLYLGSRQTSKRSNSTLQEGAQQIESLGSSGTEPAPVIGKTENATITNKRVFPPALGSNESEQLSVGKNRSKQAETVSIIESSTKGDQTRNFSATSGEKGHIQRKALFPQACLFCRLYEILEIKGLVMDKVSLFNGIYITNIKMVTHLIHFISELHQY